MRKYSHSEVGTPDPRPAKPEYTKKQQSPRKPGYKQEGCDNRPSSGLGGINKASRKGNKSRSYTRGTSSRQCEVGTTYKKGGY
jgi:hypothetical protein